KVVKDDLSKLSWSAVFFREFIGRSIHSIFGLGKLLYIMAGFTKEKEGLHDFIADTRVIHIDKEGGCLILCGRYTLLAAAVAIRRRFHIEKPITHYEPSYNIAPTEDVLSVIYDPKRGERRAGFMKWGLVPFWAKDKKRASNMINARSETIHEKPSFKHLLMRKRCLVVAD